MSEKSWADGLASGAFKNKGKQPRKHKAKEPKLKVGIRKIRLAKRGLTK